VASVLHDVGKFIVSQEILTKPGRLTAEEFARVKLHPEAGYLILKDILLPWPIAEAVWQHHERMDGSGYPRGLKGDEILPVARIVAIADVLDAMTSARSYRPASKLEVVLLELECQAGTRRWSKGVSLCSVRSGVSFRVERAAQFTHRHDDSASICTPLTPVLRRRFYGSKLSYSLRREVPEGPEGLF
jgi:hypothetical protein